MAEFDFKKLVKPAVLIGTAVLGIVSGVIADKERDNKIAEEVAKQLSKKED